MSRRNSLESHPEEPEREPERYDPAAHPRVAERLAVLNELALWDEKDREITYPRAAGPGMDTLALLLRAEAATRGAESTPLRIASFDIDLTVSIPEDELYEDHSPVPPEELLRLKAEGWVVGTCSDREPTGQQALMESLGITPDFCIPKELLDQARRLLPGAELFHIGDDPKRDRDIAHKSGWQHRWPAEWMEGQDGK